MPEKTFTVTFTSKTPTNHPMKIEVGDHTLVEGEPYEGLTQEEVDRIKEDFGGKDGPLKITVGDAPADETTAKKPNAPTGATAGGVSP